MPAVIAGEPARNMLNDGNFGLFSTVEALPKPAPNGLWLERTAPPMVDFAGAESAMPANGEIGGTVGGVFIGFMNGVDTVLSVYELFKNVGRFGRGTRWWKRISSRWYCNCRANWASSSRLSYIMSRESLCAWP